MEFFQPNAVQEGYNLAISSGNQGARLTHDHNKHYTFVLQSLTLWQVNIPFMHICIYIYMYQTSSNNGVIKFCSLLLILSPYSLFFCAFF